MFPEFFTYSLVSRNYETRLWPNFQKYLVITSFSVKLTSLRKMLGEGKSNWTLRLLRRVEMFDWTGVSGEKQLSDPTDTSEPRSNENSVSQHLIFDSGSAVLRKTFTHTQPKKNWPENFFYAKVHSILFSNLQHTSTLCALSHTFSTFLYILIISQHFTYFLTLTHTFSTFSTLS